MTLSNLECRILVNGKPIKTHYDEDGRKWVEARDGSTYTLDIKNNSDYRALAVISVDGINVINGEPAEMTCENGYVVNPHSNLLVEGWRISDDQVKEFVFTFNKDQSYSVKLGNGKETLGVVGVAFFRAKELESKSTTIIHHYPNYWPWYPWWPYYGPYYTTTVSSGTHNLNAITYDGSTSSGITSGTTSVGSSNVTLNGGLFNTSFGGGTTTAGDLNANVSSSGLTANATFTASTSEAINLSSSIVDFAAGTGKGDVIDSRVSEVTIPDCLYVGTETIYYDSYDNLKKRGVIREGSVGLPKPFKNTKYCEDI
jgi:hypothetical protein